MGKQNAYMKRARKITLPRPKLKFVWFFRKKDVNSP